jgi:hypothetical protein
MNLKETVSRWDCNWFGSRRFSSEETWKLLEIKKLAGQLEGSSFSLLRLKLVQLLEIGTLAG